MSTSDQIVDETVVNGAQLFYAGQFGIDNDDDRSTWLTGLVNSAPYLCCAFIGCWLTTPFNNAFGRRGTIFITCLFSALACFWQGFVNSWWHMFIARFALGLGIGPKSATVPVYAAETTPPGIRGALVMQWQVCGSLLPTYHWSRLTGVDVDSIWYHGGICVRSCVLLRPRYAQHHWSQLENHDGICNAASCGCMLLRLHVS